MTFVPELSVVVPAYNEEHCLADTLDQLSAELTSMRLSWEMVIVNDGSSDATSRLARAHADSDARIRVIDIPHAGKGAAVRHGMLAARGAWCFLSDADLSMPADNLRRFFDPAVGRPATHITLGSREAAGARRFDEPFRRHFVGRLFNIAARLLLGSDIQDTQCGFKLFSREAAQTLFRAQQLDGFSFDVEVLALARRAGFSIREIPIDWRYSPHSKVTLRTGAAAFLDLLRIRWNLFRGAYEPLATAVDALHGRGLTG